MLWLRGLDGEALDDRLATLLAGYEREPLTYAEVGASARTAPPPSYARLTQLVVAGRGRETYERLSRHLLGWGLQRGIGLRIATSAPHVEPGATVVMATGGPSAVPRLVVPCRIVGVSTGTTRTAFAYGTLRRHPLRGEEEFSVTLERSDDVVVRIHSFSRPVGLAAWGAPASRLVQRTINRRYLAAAVRAAAAR